MRAVIMAGGKGTRLHAMTNDRFPKPMIPVAGKPILQWQIERLRENNISEICIVVGHLGEKIRVFLGDGAAFGVSICYFHEDMPLGTAGALAHIGDFIRTEDFLLVYGDSIFDIDIGRMLEFHKRMKAHATLFVHPNTHPWDSDLVILDESARILRFDKKNEPRESWYDNMVNAGLYILNPSMLAGMSKQTKIDLENDLLWREIRRTDRVYGYHSTEYIKDAGTVERIAQVERDIEAGVVSAKNLSKKQRCIFLDRDGTLNQYRGLISKPEELEVYENAAEAVRKINASSYLAIVVTNQPVVARGLCGLEDVHRIHRKFVTLLGQAGAYLDDIRFCPHHPDRGYPEENPAYKIPCECRKPGIQMLTDCAEKWNIDLSRSWLIGDTTLDIQTGKNAEMKTVLIQTGEAGRDHKYEAIPDAECVDVLGAIDFIMAEGG